MLHSNVKLLMATGRNFWLRWILYYSLGELLAIAAAAIVGAFLFIGPPDKPLTHLTTLILLGIAGCTEGLIIGWTQWKSFSKVLLHLRPIPWIATTTVSAMAGWLLVLPPAIVLISVLARFSLINNHYSFFYTALVGMTFGVLMGVPQFFYLRKFYNNAAVWILANVLGWMCSFLVIYSFISLLLDSGSFAYNFSLILISCLLSGIIQGLVTGAALHFCMSVKHQHLKTVSKIGSALVTDIKHGEQ
jgi:hypothetical protein